MANKILFQSLRALTRAPNVRNEAGGPAYAFAAEHALAQYAVTGCLHGTFYADAREQLDELLRLAAEVPSHFLARTAVYARRHGHMKDAPAVLLAVLASRDGALFEQAFDHVIDNARMLRNFVQVMRSGATGRRSLGSRPRRCVRRWLDRATDEQLLHASVGADPSLADVVKLVHPAPRDDARNALYRWLLGKPYDGTQLPPSVRAYEDWKTARLAGDRGVALPKVPFQMLTHVPLDRTDWTQIARRGRWHMTRMNLNTFLRHGVFADDRRGRELVQLVARRLRDPEAIRKARVFPYQLLAAYANARPEVPEDIRGALHDAMELATANVPAIDGRVAICPDVSGSMHSSISGWRPGATSAVRCVDVAALVASAILRNNPRARLMPFEHRLVNVRLDPRDTVLSNAQRLASVGGGGTSLSAPLERLVKERARVDVVIFVSDNESWCDAARRGEATRTQKLWDKIRRNNPTAKLVCIDLQPYGTTQVRERADVLNIGGFSDAVFGLIADFAAGRMTPEHWVGVIHDVTL